LISNIGIISYSISGVGYLALAILLLISWRGRIEGGMLLAAVVVQFLWSGLLATNSLTGIFSTYNIFTFEIIKIFFWTIFMLKLLNTGSDQKILPYMKYIFYTLIVAAIFIVLFKKNIIIKIEQEYDIHLLKFALLTFSIFGLVLVEQIYRNIQPEKKWAIKFLCIGLAALFAYDLYLYSDASLFEDIDTNLWDARGIINALSIPLIAISAKRNSKWSFDIFVSRHVVFYSTGVIAVGVYLILMSLSGYYLKIYGGSWGGFVQIVFLVGTMLILFVVMSSGTTRAKLRVFLSKHFYKNKYDYRDEWLRLIHNISDYKTTSFFKGHIIQTVACILQCRGGLLFLKESNGFHCASSWNCQDIDQNLTSSSSLVKFLNKHEWIIDVNEYRINQAKYDSLILPEWILDIPSVWLVIPLKHQYEINGFFILLESGINKHTNWEDRDLLKAAGRQISSYLAFIQTAEALNQAEQFAAFNRLSAYVVHDLKNSVSQLELIIQNAKEHKDNPDFITDSFLTVGNVVTRMQKMLNQLRKMRFTESETRKVNLKDALLKVVASRSAQNPVPELKTQNENLFVYVESERFINTMEHLVQNAQEATSEDGFVTIELTTNDDFAVIKVEDNGSGMTQYFIKERLFRPFDTTKGNAGMGIGVFEVKEFVNLNGGMIAVSSEIDAGTVFKIKLPLHNENYNE